MEDKAALMGFTLPPSLDDLQEIAESLISQLPRELMKYTGKLKVEVEDFPDEFIEEQLEIEDPFEVLGVYQSAGPAAIGRVSSPEKRKDVVYLYRRPLIDQWAETEETLTWLINRVILHEIGHHFGMTEAEIETFEEEINEGLDQLILCE